MSDRSADSSAILVVDDNPNNVGVLFDLLDTAGFEVRVARDGLSCLDKVAFAAPDLILLDVLMPGIDGFETCARLKAEARWADIPVIFMTALTDTNHKLRGLRLGAVDYITKPFVREEVLARVQLHLQRDRLARQLQAEVSERAAAQAALQRFNQDLEARVAARTQELQATLDALQTAQAQLLAQQHQLQHDAYHDTLTGLPNRAWLYDRLQQVLAAAERDRLTYAVLFVDLDRFKVINDSLGHLWGDKLLLTVAQRLRDCLPTNAGIARFGGDEFVVLLEGTDDLARIAAIAEELLTAVQVPIALSSYQLRISTSIGITLSSHGYQEPEAILRDADIALYAAKQAGRNGYRYLTPGLRQAARSRLALEQALHRALERQEFCLYYQPIVSLDERRLCGFEALIRWLHPERGFVSPDEFIPVAEETGLIRPLGWWVLETAIAQQAAWQAQFPEQSLLPLNVNLAPAQLTADFAERLAALLATAGVAPAALKLEITEGCLLEASPPVLDCFSCLQTLGVDLCLDDFGTGYSALSRLHEFPIAALKIDKSFVDRLAADAASVRTVQAIVALAGSLNLQVVAEGIETELQCERLQALGCRFGQGYLFARPLPAAAASQVLAEPVPLSRCGCPAE